MSGGVWKSRGMHTHHDNQPGPTFGVLAQMFGAEGEDDRIADGLEEEEREEASDACASWREGHCHGERGAGDAVEAQ